ncbi:MAG: DUF1592 domain-containing protein [Bacteroidia bacterium]|nr:DUF1592 domain-containing protein [Bacteroidia bacterium]
MFPQSLLKNCFVFSVLTFSAFLIIKADTEEDRRFRRVVKPIMIKHCQSCHNALDQKAGINFEDYVWVHQVVRNGNMFTKLIEEVETGQMPPKNKPRLSQSEKDTLIIYINRYLEEALNDADPGLIPPRRLSNREYKFSIYDLLGIKIPVDSIFPTDPSGGGGFDNQGGTLFINTLLMEKYYDAADLAIEKLYKDETRWREIVPVFHYPAGHGIRSWWVKMWSGEDIRDRPAVEAARDVVIPFATRAFRRFLTVEEENRLISFFREVYGSATENAYETAVKETLKMILISHQFLLRTETDPLVKGPYEITNFELATRLSSFLWSSLPDETLLEVAYRQNLHDPEVLTGQVMRMLRDPKSFRMSESFSTQWLETSRLEDPSFSMDPNMFPEFDPVLREVMNKEVALYFHYVLSESKNFLDLLDSDYTFLNEQLAEHYCIDGVKGEEMRKVTLSDRTRGGLTGMAAVLTTTSLPHRTSPVLRGKWILEQILGTPAKPPPPNVPELEAAKKAGDELTVRQLMALHSANPACSSCHQEMDPLGFGLENYDPIGRWRDNYVTGEIDVTGVLKTGEKFEGPVELKKILLKDRELFARNLSEKMISFSLGRPIQFKDKRTLDHLTKTLIETNFDTTIFIRELVLSFPFRYKISDPIVTEE